LDYPQTHNYREKSQPAITSLIMPNFNNLFVAPCSQTNAERTAQGTPKYRSACDACGSAKVRCDRSKPKCGRCTTRELSCNYGIDNQHGLMPLAFCVTLITSSLCKARRAEIRCTENSGYGAPKYTVWCTEMHQNIGYGVHRNAPKYRIWCTKIQGTVCTEMHRNTPKYKGMVD
jgi:hypothetical protein